MPDHELKPRKMTLTEADLEALAEMLRCNKCSFTSEEVQFVKDWMDTAKQAKSEIIRWLVRCLIVFVGLMAGLQVAMKMGWYKGIK